MSAAQTDPLAWVDRLGRARVLVVGDVMLDRFVYGAVDRISPEGPIAILRVQREAAMAGGAGNVLRNLAALGARGVLVGVIGRDAAGSELQQLLARQDAIQPLLIADRHRATTIKTRYIGGAQQLLRADRESEGPLPATVRRALLARALGALKRCGVMVLSDYGKGALGEGIAGELIAAARRVGKPVLVDPKGGDFARYAGADLVTPNLRELAEASGMPVQTDAQVEQAARRLIARHRLGAVLATRSSRGVTLVPARGKALHVPAEAREVFDVAGAGDTVMAAVAAALAVQAPLAIGAMLGNAAAGIVVAKVGTAVASAEELRATLSRQRGATATAKIMSLDDAVGLAARWRGAGLRVGFTNGCFDLLHPGHVSLLRQARAACDRLIVGLNSDRSVRRLKGAGRPVQSEPARAAVLASLGDVDGVVIFDQDTPMALIEALRPELLVKGADYSEATVVGAALVRSYGGQILLAALTPGHSTTRTIGRLGRGRAGPRAGRRAKPGQKSRK